MVIRKVKYEDIEQIVDIDIKDWKIMYRGIIDDNILKNLDRNKKIEKYKKRYETEKIIVAENNETVLGFCWYDDNIENEKNGADSEIVAIYVDCDNLGNGIGKKMMEYVMKELKNEGKRKMILWCLEKNENARKFYEKMGGKLVNDEKYFEIEGQKYKEVGYIYNI